MAETLVRIDQPDQSDLMRVADAAFVLAESFAIDAPDVAELAAEELRAIVTRKKALDEQRLSITRPIDQAKANIMALFKPAIDRLAQAEGILKKAISDWHDAQEAKRIAMQRELEAQAEAERKRLAEESERLAAEARALEAAGMADGAAVLQQKATEVALTQQMIVAPAAEVTTKLAGVSTGKRLDFEVTDKMALLKHVLANPALSNLVTFDQVALRRYVGALGENASIPGVRLFHKSQVSARRAA